MARCRPHRLGDQDAALSRLKPGFESPWGHQINSRTRVSGSLFFSPFIPSRYAKAKTGVPQGDAFRIPVPKGMLRVGAQDTLDSLMQHEDKFSFAPCGTFLNILRVTPQNQFSRQSQVKRQGDAL